MRVVVLRVFADHVFEVAAADNQQSVEALAPNASDPALGVRPRLRRLHRRLDHPYAFGAEDLIEITGELAVAVTDEKPRPDAFVAKLHQEVACLLGHPAAIRVGRDPGQVDAPGRKLDEKEHVEALQEERVDGEEVALQEARRLSPQELAPVLLEPLRRRLDPRLLQNRPDGARGQLDPKPDQLTLDPPVAPARVLPREPHHERTHLGASRWASGTTMRIRPAARDQLAMPTQKCRWRPQQRRLPRPTRQYAAEGSQQHPITWRQRGTSDLTLQHPQLMPQQQVSRPGESHPRALSDPDVSLSTHPAPIIQPWAARPGASGQRGLALAVRGLPRTSVLARRGRAAACISSWPNERGSR